MTQINENQVSDNYRHSNHEGAVKLNSRTNKSKKPKSSLNSSRSQIFEPSVVLRKSPFWSRTIMTTLIGLACFGIGWAYFAKIEQIIPATGQLKSEGTAKEVQAPINGVVKSVYIKDGQHVQSGDLLLAFDSVATKAELDSLRKVHDSLIQEIQIYRHLINFNSPESAEVSLSRKIFPKEAAFLLKNRVALVAENELFRTELKNSILGIKSLSSDEQKRLKISKTEQDTRAAAANFQIEQSKKKLTQIKIDISAKKETLAIEERILNKLKILSEQSRISQLQYIQQQKQVQSIIAEINKLLEEQKRLNYEIQQGQQQLKNTIAASDKRISDQIAENKNRIAEIDSKLTKNILENEKQLAETDSKISQTQLNFQYQTVTAPVAGTVFDLQAKKPGFVAKTSQKLLQIIPNDNLIAEAEITNKDIGFVREGMKVDVNIDSFPYSEFGDVKGKLIVIGSDALPPDETHKNYRFPVKIKLHKQSLSIGGRNISLQPGMSITANIKVREERTVMSLFTELFTKQVDKPKQVQ